MTGIHTFEDFDFSEDHLKLGGPLSYSSWQFDDVNPQID